MDFRDALRIVRSLGFGKEGGAFGVGGQHDVEQAFIGCRRFLIDAADAPSLAQRDRSGVGMKLPRISFRRVVFPEPLRPTKPVFQPSEMAALAPRAAACLRFLQ